MKHNFTIERKGYLAKDHGGEVYFYDAPPRKMESITGIKEWYPIKGKECYILEIRGKVSDALDESTIYPVAMTISIDCYEQ